MIFPFHVVDTTGEGTEMKHLLVVSLARTVVLILLLSGWASSQCGVDVHYGLVHCVNEGEETEVDDDTCADPGPPNYYCVQGYGQCTDGTVYHTANAGPSSLCSDGECACEVHGCETRYLCNPTTCQCEFASPIVVDTTGLGFKLTSADDGVTFDILGDGHPAKIAWTSADSGNAFLALDRNHNGRIDSGKELFGNLTAQPPSADPNGYLALSEFDKPENGGNGDGIIDSRDAVYSKLLLWIDANHNGISESNELHTLPELRVFSIDLHYHDARRFDEYGNWFHYTAALNPDALDGKSKDGRRTYDVFFQVDTTQAARRKGASAQSRVPGRLKANSRQFPILRVGYRRGETYEELVIGFGQRNENCPTN